MCGEYCVYKLVASLLHSEEWRKKHVNIFTKPASRAWTLTLEAIDIPVLLAADRDRHRRCHRRSDAGIEMATTTA